MSLDDRMADAKFEIRAPLCLSCKNRVDHEFDSRHFDRPTMTCKVLGEIPRAISIGCEYKCEHFDVNEKDYEMNKPFMPNIE